MNRQKGEFDPEVIGVLIVVAVLVWIGSAASSYFSNIEKAHFSTFSQRAASYVPFATNESDKLAFKIDELMATNVVLKEKKEGTRLAFNEYVRSINRRRDQLNTGDLSKEERAYAESLIAQETEYRNKLDQKFESLRRATLEIDYLITYAKNRYKMLGSDKERSEMIDRIDSLTSKTRSGAR